MVKLLITFLAIGTAIAQQPGDTPAPAPEATTFTPATYQVSTYEPIWSKSPFEFEIVVEEIAAEEDTTFDDLRLSGYSDRGSYYVATIYDQKAPTEKIRIDSRKPADQNDGFKFLKVERGVSYKQTRIWLEKNGVPGDVGYDDKRLSSPLTAASGGGNARNPNSRVPARTAQSRQAGQRPSANTNQQANNNNNAAAGNATTANAADAGTDRNAVIQRLLERARQNQSGGDAGTTNAATNNATNTNGTTSDNSSPRPRRRRVVLPPSTQ